MTLGRGLAELRERSAPILDNRLLVDIASKFSPSAAYEVAIDKNATPDQARACRYLAMIRRDYGQEAFETHLRERGKGEALDFIEKVIEPKVRLLESITGQPLIVVTDNDQQMTFLDYLKTLPLVLKVDLRSANYEVQISWSIDQRHQEQHSSCVFEQSCSVSISEQELFTKSAISIPSKIIYEKDYPELTMEMLEFVSKLIHSWSAEIQYQEESITAVIVKHQKAGGEPVIEPLFRQADPWGMVDRADVDSILVLADRIRADNKDVKPCYLAHFNAEIEYWLRLANRRKKAIDPSISLQQKLDDDVVDIAGRYTVIPGETAKRTYNFFLYTEHRSGNWVETLTELGYAGSILISSGVMASGHGAVETGQIDALLIHDLIGSSSKVWWINRVQASLEEAGKDRLPSFCWKALMFSERHNVDFHCTFGDFLRKNFPLELPAE